MARLRNINSGAIVSVADEKVERLGAEWEPISTEIEVVDSDAPAEVILADGSPALVGEDGIPVLTDADVTDEAEETEPESPKPAARGVRK